MHPKNHKVYFILIASFLVIVGLVASKSFRTLKIMSFQPQGWQDLIAVVQLRSELNNKGFLIRRGPIGSGTCTDISDSWNRPNITPLIYRYGPQGGLSRATEKDWNAPDGRVFCCGDPLAYSKKLTNFLAERDRVQSRAWRVVLTECTGRNLEGIEVISVGVSSSERFVAIVTAELYGIGLHGMHGAKGSPSQHYIQVLSLKSMKPLTRMQRFPMRSRIDELANPVNPIIVGWTPDEKFIVCADRKQLCLVDFGRHYEEADSGR